MPKLVSMKMSKKASKEQFAIEADAGDVFPHGLRVHLNDESMNKLQFDELPAVGTEMIIVAVGVVASASENRRQGGTSRDMSIQIEELEIEPSDEPDAVDAVTKAIKDT